MVFLTPKSVDLTTWLYCQHKHKLSVLKLPTIKSLHLHTGLNNNCISFYVLTSLWLRRHMCFSKKEPLAGNLTFSFHSQKKKNVLSSIAVWLWASHLSSLDFNLLFFQGNRFAVNKVLSSCYILCTFDLAKLRSLNTGLMCLHFTERQ